MPNPTDLHSKTVAPKLSQFYATRFGSYDEMLSSEHEVQAHWRQFIDSLEEMGGLELDIRRKESQRLLRENGVTYTVYSDSGHFSRAWKLDPIPLIIGAKEWLSIEQGLIQRAELLNLILQDLLGPQRLLKNGLLPTELIYAHQGFLAPCVGSLTKDARLTIYAANLARGPGGNMWVLNDHTQAPSGIGYSLENRSVISQVMADLFQQSHVRRLSSFFSALQRGLAQSAPHNKDDPHIVVLTPGSLNETYFEHAYLAAQLGFTLAQGEDLTVRDGKVWLRTLEGLQAVDVLLRRVDDSFCDPLELRSSSQLGVPGLLQAVRQGNVSIANPLGGSILENPGLLAFLPGLCRHFLSEELKLPSVATWWCGQRKEREFVINNLSRMTIKSINRNNNQAIFGHTLNRAQCEHLIAKIKAQPHLYVGQEHISFSTAPALSNQNIEPRNAVLRSFAVNCDNDYQIMPGGLTRVASNKHQIHVSNQFGAISKDTWILDDEEIPASSSALVNIQSYMPAISEPLTSRAADNLFWVGRNFERILSSSRLLRTILAKQNNLMSGFDKDNQHCLTVLLRALTHLTASYPGFIDLYEASDQQQEILSLFKDPERSGTLAYNIQGFFRAAFNIRDLWSQDTWRCIDSLQYYWQSQVINLNHPFPQLSRYLTELNTRLAAFSGLTAESMTRESGWLMLQLGRQLERALSLISLLRATVVVKQPPNRLNPILEALLLTTDSFSLYQRRYRSATRLPMLLELLLGDNSHPYSLLFQLQTLNELSAALPGPRQKNRLRREQQLILQAHTNLQLCDFTVLLDTDDSGVYDNLEDLLKTCAELLSETADVISQTYFNHIVTTQQLSPTWAEERL